LKTLNGYDPDSYLKLILTENESLRQRKKLLQDKMSQLDDHLRILSEFNKKNEAELDARANDKAQLQKLFDTYKKQFIEEKVLTGEQSRAMIKQIMKQEYDLIERQLRKAEEKNLGLNHEWQRYYNFHGAENIKSGGFIDQELLQHN
jgi:hypothetical protein